MKVRVATMGLAGEAGLFLAFDRGYFKQEGLDVELIPNLTAPDMTAALLSGSIDVGSLALNAPLFNAAPRGVGLRVVAPQTFIPPDDKNGSMLVRMDLIDSGQYRDPKDFKGKSIAIGPVPNLISQLFVEIALDKGGLRPADATFTTLAFPDELAALAAKKLDAGWQIEPLATAAETRGLAREVMWSGQLLPNLDPLLLIESPKFGQDQAEAVNRFVTAHLRGQRDYYAAYRDASGGADARAAVMQSLVEHTSVKDTKTWQELADKGRMQSVEPNGELHVAMFETVQDFFLRQGALSGKIDAASIVDKAPLNYAVQRLGRVS
jgi:NitT/TauT family transport system substrate-binding protein